MVGGGGGGGGEGEGRRGGGILLPEDTSIPSIVKKFATTLNMKISYTYVVLRCPMHHYSTRVWAKYKYNYNYCRPITNTITLTVTFGQLQLHFQLHFDVITIPLRS